MYSNYLQILSLWLLPIDSFHEKITQLTQIQSTYRGEQRTIGRHLKGFSYSQRNSLGMTWPRDTGRAQQESAPNGW